MKPKYVPGREELIHGEFLAFLSARPDDAADTLAILCHIAVAGFSGLDGEVRDRFGPARPYCHQAAGWGLFFEIDGWPWDGPCGVTVLLVAEFAVVPIEMAKQMARQRWAIARS